MHISGSGISWAVCKSASRSRQIITPGPHHSVFYRPDALPATQPTASKHRSGIQLERFDCNHTHTQTQTRVPLTVTTARVEYVLPSRLLATHWYLPACESCTGQIVSRLSTRRVMPSPPGGRTMLSTSSAGNTFKTPLLPSQRHTDICRRAASSRNSVQMWPIIPLTHKTGHFGDVSRSQSLGLVWKKLNLTQHKHAFANQKKCTTTQNKHTKLKPGLVAFYNIRPYH